MGNFVLSLPGDSPSECISAARVNLRLYEESIEGESNGDAGYLLGIALHNIEQALISHKEKFRGNS